MNVSERFELYESKVMPLLSKGIHYDNMPKEEVSELISDGTKTTPGQQLAQISRNMIKYFRSSENPFQDEEFADKLEELHKSVRKPRGKKSAQVDEEKMKKSLAAAKARVGL